MQKYAIFNPINGLHTTVDSIKEAREQQITVMREHVQSVVFPMFSCNLETTNEDGSKTWTAFDLELEKEVEQIVKDSIRKSIVDFFGVGSFITYDLVRQVLIEEGLIKEDQMYDIDSEQPIDSSNQS
jgi:hypothetical protein